MAAPGGGDASVSFSSGDVVRLVNLKLMQLPYEGNLVAIQDHNPARGICTVILSTGERLEVAQSSAKKVDSEDLFQTGDFIRLRALPMMMMSHEGELAIVQHYVPLKDMWQVQMQTANKGMAMVEVYSSSMKKQDEPDLFFIGELLRITSGDSTGEVVTIRGYEPLKDKWKVTLITGRDIDIFSENTVKVRPDAFAEGDLVVVDGSNLVIQQYLSQKDKWRAITNEGTPVDIYAEEAGAFKEPELGAAFEGLASAGGSGFSLKGLFGGKSATPTEKPSGGGFLKGLWGGGSSSSSGKKAQETSASTPETQQFAVGDQVHLSRVTWRDDGTMALVKDVSTTGAGRPKYKVVLNTGDVVETTGSHLKPPLPEGRFREGQMVRVSGEGPATIFKVFPERGMIGVRVKGKKDRTVFPDQLESTGAAGAAPVGLSQGRITGSGSATPPTPVLADLGSSHASVSAQPDPFAAATAADPAPAPVAPAQGHGDAVLEELLQKLAEAGTSIAEVAQYSDTELDELLKDELKVSVIKRVRMKQLIRSGGGGGASPAVPPVPAPAAAEPSPMVDPFAAPAVGQQQQQQQQQAPPGKHSDPLDFFN